MTNEQMTNDGMTNEQMTNDRMSNNRVTQSLYWAFVTGLWSLGLARYLGEALYLRPFFDSPLAVCGLALVGMAAGWVLGHAIPSSPDRTGSWVGLLLPLLYLLAPQPDPLMGLVLLAGGACLTLLIASPFIRKHSALLLAVAVFVLYLRTIGQAVGEADTFEFQVVAPTLGIAHPTGYPLYILLGRLFSLLPLGTVAWRVNLTSAVFGTGAVLLLYRLLGHPWWMPSPQGNLNTPDRARGKAGYAETELMRPIALLSALALAFSRVLWSQAVVAEVYGLNLLFVAGALTLTIALLQGQKGPRTVWMLAFLLGLSLTNHLTMVLFFPAAGLALFLSHPRLRWREWLIGLGLFLLGLSVYAYIPLRWPALHNGQQMGMGEFLAYVTGRQFSGALQFHLLHDPNRYAILGRLLLEPFGWTGLLLAAIGLIWAIVRHLRLALVSIVAFLAYALYGMVYQVPDISVFLLPTHLLLALWIGLGATGLTRMAFRLRPWASNIVLASFALLPLSRIWLNFPVVDQSKRVEAEPWGRYVLGLPLAPGAAVLADGEKFAPLYYLQKTEGLRPDLDLVVYFTEAEYWADLMARLTAGQSVYLARYLPHLEGFYLRSLGPLVEIGTEPMSDLPAEAQPVGVKFGSEVELVAFTLEGDSQGRPLLHLTLYWRAGSTPQNDLEVRLRLVDEAGEVDWLSNGTRPVNDLYPTNGWPPDLFIADYHPVPLSPWLVPGRYRLEVGLFPRFSEEGLPVEGETGSWWPLTQVVIDRPIPGRPLPYEVRMLLGPVWLAGYDIPTSVPAGSHLTLDLAWVHVEESGTVRIEWVDDAGQIVDGQDMAVAEKMERSRVPLVAPGIPGMYRIWVGWEGKMAHCHWLALPTNRCVLATVKVAPVQQGLANFGGKILLVAAELGSDRIRPGELLPITLHWKPLRVMEEDYTITVQLLGPDGRLHGQVDAWPVQGTMPTSRWLPGQEITDPYQVALLPGSPPGQYQVIVGIYLLATMERVLVIDEAGNPVGDHYVVGKIEVGD
jgi:hypothetical protein